MTLSAFEVLPASRLSELWLEQSLFDDRLFLRVGQLSASTEYMVSQTSILFANGTFGWPEIFAANMTDGARPTRSRHRPSGSNTCRPRSCPSMQA
jgi:porin